MRALCALVIAASLGAGCDREPTARPGAEPAPSSLGASSLEHPAFAPGGAGLSPRPVGRRTLCAGGDRSCALFDGRPACWTGEEPPRFVGDAADATLLACDATALCALVPPGRVVCGEHAIPLEETPTHLWLRGHLACAGHSRGVSCWDPSGAGEPPPLTHYPGALEILATPRGVCVLTRDALDCPEAVEGAPTLRELDGFEERCGVDRATRQVWCGSADRSPSRVAALDGSDDVAVGGFVCARGAGRVRCVAADDRSVAHDVGLTGAVELAVGAAHACARTRDGALHCWRGASGAAFDIGDPR